MSIDGCHSLNTLLAFKIYVDAAHNQLAMQGMINFVSATLSCLGDWTETTISGKTKNYSFGSLGSWLPPCRLHGAYVSNPIGLTRVHRVLPGSCSVAVRQEEIDVFESLIKCFWPPAITRGGIYGLLRPLQWIIWPPVVLDWWWKSCGMTIWPPSAAIKSNPPGHH